jgi:adenylyltransferase/sulfurtransferase
MDGYFRRQIQLREIGETGQQKLSSSKVLVIGAGGLGCALLQNLVSCGVGHITIVDSDVVEYHNLHRQTLFAPFDVGKSKAEIAARFLSERYPHCHIYPINAFFDAEMAVSLMPGIDILIDCTDNLPVRYLVDDAARIFDKPWVHASVSKFNLQWALFRPGIGYAYRNIYPVPPNPMFIGQCNAEGILGAVPSLAGTLQANVVLNALLGLDNTDGKLFHLDTRNGSSYAITYAPVSVTEPATADELINYNYERFCQNFNP